MIAPTGPTDPAFAELLLVSYQRLVGTPLVDTEAGETADATWLYGAAPFCLLAHDTGADPRFIYANRTAQACFDYTWDELIGLPSRLSAQAPEQAERQALLAAVARDGFARNYRGIRIAKSGRRFWIEDAVIWEIVDNARVKHGTAALIRTWHDLEEQR